MELFGFTVTKSLFNPWRSSHYFTLFIISGLTLRTESYRVLSFRQRSVTCKLSFEIYYIQADFVSFDVFLLTKDDIKSLPISNTLPATVFTLSSSFDFSSNSPLISANSAELSNRNTFKWGDSLSFSLIKSESKYFLSLLILSWEYYFPSIFREAQKFFSGRMGIMCPGYISKSCCCKNSKSLNLLLTSVLSLSNFDLEYMVYNL